MSEAVVLDSSAILALLNDERGAAEVAAVLDRAVVGAVNLAEVAAKLSEKGLDRAEIEDVLDLFHDVRPFSTRQALETGELRRATRHLGLSLGDRACLALAIELGAVAMTSDAAWSDIDAKLLQGARVRMLR